MAEKASKNPPGLSDTSEATPTPPAVKIGRGVKVGINYPKLAAITQNCGDVCTYANDVIIPTAKAYGRPVATAAEVLRYCNNPQEIEADAIKDFITAKAGRGATGLLLEVYEEKARAEFEEADLPSIPRQVWARPQHPELLRLSKDEDGQPRLTYDQAAATEAATRYITTPGKIEAYNRHQAAAKALNAFFQGRIPHRADLNAFFHVNEAGEVLCTTEQTDYKKFSNVPTE